MRENDMPCCETLFWVFLVICLVLLSFAGITSGLALGLLSFRKVDLEVLIKAGQPQAQKNAAKILPLVKNEHLLLCTLLIGKSLAMGALPIFLDSIVPAWAAIAASVILVFAFAEIIPQALCSRYGLTVGAKLSLLVRFLLLVFLPISYPISKLLDWLLGKEHSALFRRPELKTLVALHANEAGKGGDLSHHETSIINGALDLTQKTAKDAMTPISETFSLDINSKLTMKTMGLVMSKGHSRIPIYFGKPNNIIGLILVKNLIFCRPEDETPVKYLTLRRMPRVYDDWPLYDILNQFMMGSSHMALVVKCKKDINKAENDAVAKGNMLCTTSNLDTKQLGRKGLVFPIYQEEHLSATIGSPLYSSDIESQSNTLNNVMEQDRDLHPWFEDIESFSASLDEEVIGIITLEDVMEELLQEEIADETDKYVDVHNKIKVNPLASIPSSRSLRRSSFSRLQLINSEPASLSSWSPPTLHTSTSPNIRPPLIKSTLPASLVKSLPNSPARSRSTFRSSSFVHRLSRMSHENIQLPNQL